MKALKGRSEDMKGTENLPMSVPQPTPFAAPAPSNPEHSSPQSPPTAVQLPTDRTLVMRVMPMPSDANGNGDIFGGWIMSQVDIAGAVLPARIAKGRIATVAVNQFIFKQPVSISDLLSFYATVERVGNTSITVRVDVYAERNPADLQVVKVTEANLTYVAIDLAGKPRLIPKAATPTVD